MNVVLTGGWNQGGRHSRVSSRGVRILLLLFFTSLTLCAPGACRAKETCPWLNEATAAGFLDVSVSSTVTHSEKDKNDATCEFTHRDGSAITELRIEVETMTGPPGAFTSYLTRCGSHAAPLKAIGNEAVACGFDGKKRQVSEQVVGRVRDRAFIVTVTSNVNSPDRTGLREKARKVAEQVAGFLF
jgi:hypothetical protein